MGRLRRRPGLADEEWKTLMKAALPTHSNRRVRCRGGPVRMDLRAEVLEVADRLAPVRGSSLEPTYQMVGLRWGRYPLVQ